MKNSPGYTESVNYGGNYQSNIRHKDFRPPPPSVKLRVPTPGFWNGVAKIKAFFIIVYNFFLSKFKYIYISVYCFFYFFFLGLHLFFLFFFNCWQFLIVFLFFYGLLIFCLVKWFFFSIINVTSKSYIGYYWTPKLA